MDRHRHGVGVGIKFHAVLRAVVEVGGFFRLQAGSRIGGIETHDFVGEFFLNFRPKRRSFFAVRPGTRFVGVFFVGVKKITR